MLKTYFKANWRKLLRITLLTGVVLSALFAVVFIALVLINKESIISFTYVFWLFSYIVIMSNCIGFCITSIIFWWKYHYQTISLEIYHQKMQEFYGKYSFSLNVFVPQSNSELAYLYMLTKLKDCKVSIARTPDYTKFLRNNIFRIEITPYDQSKQNVELILSPAEWNDLKSVDLETMIEKAIAR